jgi:hypothetical protein
VITLRHRTSGPAIALGLVLAGLLAGPSIASANSVECRGFTAPVTPKSRTLDYRFTCSEEIKAYSIVSNLEVGEFSTEATVLDPKTGDPISGQSFGCEGAIPSDGFGCSGYAIWANQVSGQFGLDEARCIRGRNQLHAWLVAVDMNNTASGPFALYGTRCPSVAKPAKKKNKAHRHH